MSASSFDPTNAEIMAALQAVREELRQLKAALPAPELVTVARAAQLAGVSLSTIKRKIRDREIPVVRIGRSVRVDPSKLAVH